MTLPSAPSAISFNEISLELFCSIITYNLNDQYGRCVTCLPTPCSTISLSNFYGKTAPVTLIGTCYCGGWYIGCTTACGQNYYLLAAPGPTAGWSFDYFRTGTPAVCQNVPIFSPGPIGTNPVASYDGYCITKFIQACPGYTPIPVAAPNGYSYPMTNKINAMNLNGFSDWYFPAATELNVMFCNMDLAWKCGGQMKATGSAFPTCVPAFIPAPAAGSPGGWPYLGYVTGCVAPGISGLSTGWTCGSAWAPTTYVPGNPTGCLISTTQASGQPQSLYPTSCATLGAGFDKRFWCSGSGPQGGGWPMPMTWCSGQKCVILGARAVRRQLIT